MFYLSFNSETHQLRILHTSAGNIDEKLANACRQGPSVGITDDPFTLVTCALSSLLELQAVNAYVFSDFISKLVSATYLQAELSLMSFDRKITVTLSNSKSQKRRKPRSKKQQFG